MKRILTEATTFNKLPGWLALATIVSLIYLAVSSGAGYSGFPLDDAWIHQTYARNLGLHSQFAFTPGITSTGSTAPLWTLLLSAGYMLSIPFKLWAYMLGILLLGLSGFTMARLGQCLFPGTRWLGPLAGLALVFEWHMVWAAVSGMETILFIWLSILLLERYAATIERQTKRDFLLLGLIGGTLFLVRPEGVGLIGLIGLHRFLTGIKRDPIPKLIMQLAIFGMGMSLLILPYLAFNYSVTGLLLPNTFYAKQQEYGLWIQEQGFGLIQELSFRAKVFWVPLIGGQVLLIPGLIKSLWMIIRRRQTLVGIIALWWLSHLALYAIRLPVTYQHGRYQLPAMPWILLLGVWGTITLLKPRHRSLWIRVLSKAAPIAIGIGMLIFIGLGAQGYANDVEFIESEMVVTAQWLNENTAPDAIIAAHDIGAIGYFTERRLVDLAGLITPEVIPFIRDEPALLRFSQEQGATWLVTFPSWYPEITSGLQPVFSTNSPWAINAGYDNMVVYPIGQ